MTRSVAQCPSAYLCSHCEVCFSSTHISKEKVQVIFCLDANFQQKCNHDKDRQKEHQGEAGTCDPPVFSPHTVILSCHFVEEWEKKDQDCEDGAHHMSRCSRTVKTNTGTSDYMTMDDPAEEDVVEPGMNMPKSSLLACNDSFIATDADHIKASTQYFDDT